MGPELEQHFILIVDAPSHVVSDIEIVFGSVVDSAFATRHKIDLLDLLQILFRSFNFLQVGGVFFLVDVVGIFIEAKLRLENSLKTIGESQSVYGSHY